MIGYFHPSLANLFQMEERLAGNNYRVKAMQDVKESE